MLEKILKMGGLCLLGVGGLVLILIPGFGWVAGSAALVMTAVGVGAIVSSFWGAQSYVQREQSNKMEERLALIEREIAVMQSNNATIRHEKEIAKMELASTAMLKEKLEKLSMHEAGANQQKNIEIDQLQRDLQTVTGERDTLKMRFEDSGVNAEGDDETRSLMSRSTRQ
jgi:hypothetical protein